MLHKCTNAPFNQWEPSEWCCIVSLQVCIWSYQGIAVDVGHYLLGCFDVGINGPVKNPTPVD